MARAHLREEEDAAVRHSGSWCDSFGFAGHRARCRIAVLHLFVGLAPERNSRFSGLCTPEFLRDGTAFLAAPALALTRAFGDAGGPVPIVAAETALALLFGLDWSSNPRHSGLASAHHDGDLGALPAQRRDDAMSGEPTAG